MGKTLLERLTAKGKSYGEDIYNLTYEFVPDQNQTPYEKLMQLNDMDFLEYIIKGSNANTLNGVVTKFPAYDISLKCLQRQHMTVRQRAAITNVYLFMVLDETLDYLDVFNVPPEVWS